MKQAMRQGGCVFGVLILGSAGALVGVAPGGASAWAAPTGCATAFVARAGTPGNPRPGMVSTVDVATRKKKGSDIEVGGEPRDIAVFPNGKTGVVAGSGFGVSIIDVKKRTEKGTGVPGEPRRYDQPEGVAVTPDGNKAVVTDRSANSVSTVDVKSRTSEPGIRVGIQPRGLAITPDGKTAFVANHDSHSVSTIDPATRTKDPTDINFEGELLVGQTPTLVALYPTDVAITPDGNTAFVTSSDSATVSVVDVATRTKDPSDISVGRPGGPGLGSQPTAIAITPDGKTVFVTNSGANTVSTIDVATRTKDPTDIPVGKSPSGVAITPEGKTGFVTNSESGTVSTIDVQTRTKNRADIRLGVFPRPVGIAIARCPR